MKLAAIIAEYNPLHGGHQYHIEKTKQATGADGIVVVMGGCFVQRGEPAVFDKFLRARMALKAGADIVLELPAVFSCASAEYFAEGAVRLLNGLNCIDFLSFGCEQERLAELSRLAGILCAEPETYRLVLRARQKAGDSFAAARAAALKAVLPAEECSPDLDRLLRAPNAALALEYCKAIQKTESRIRPVLIPRHGADYHKTDLTAGEYPSATAIRSALARGASPRDSGMLPFPGGDGAPLLPLFADDASVLLNDRIARLDERADIWDLSEALLARILGNRRIFRNWSEWCLALKTKQYAYTRVSRALCHLLLDLRPSDVNICKGMTNGAYARILGLRADSRVPAALRASSRIPLVTKLADYERTAAEGAKKQLAIDLRARDLYRLLFWQKYQKTLPDDYAAGITVL